MALGRHNKINNGYSYVVGDSNIVNGSGVGILGNNNTVAQNDTYVLGSGITTTQDNSVILGNASTDRAATTVDKVTINGEDYTVAGAGSVANGIVSVGKAGAERQIINVAAGEVSATSTDAVNGSQLFATNKAIADSQTHYVSVNDDGIQGGNYNNDGAQGKNSLALGVGAKATGENAIAIGNVTTDAANSIAIGNNNVLSNTAGASTVIGSNNNVTGNEAVALGSNNTVKDFSGVAVGSYNRAFGYRSITVGAENQTDGQWSSAIGLWNTAGGERATALGANNKILGRRALGVGVVNEISSASEYSSAIGAFNKITDSTKSLAAGFSNTITGGDNNNVLGNENQLNNAKNSTAIGNKNIVAQDNTQVLGNNVTTTQANSVTLGNASTDRAATAESKVSINGQDYAFAGVGSASNGVVSVGKAGAERQIINVAAGKVSSDSTDAVNGSQLYATNQAITEVGKSAAAAKTEVVEGDNIVVTETQGKNGQSVYNVATAKEVSFNKTTVGTVITDSATGKITGLTAGEVSATSTDAINGSQLYATNQAIADSKTHYLSVNDDGVQADNYNNDGATGKNALAVGVGSKAAGENAVAIGYNNNVVQDKTVALGSSITTTQANSVVLGNESTDRAATAESKVTILGQDYAFVGVGSANNGVVSVGKAGAERQIINVAAGKVSSDSTDAVNGSQLYATNQAITEVGKSAAAAKTEVVEGDNIVVTETQGKNGQSIYNIATAKEVSFDKTTVGTVITDSTTGKITGLTAGEVSATSTDAINGSQLYATNKAIADSKTHYVSVNDDGVQADNYNNDGATGKNALAVGVGSKAAGENAVAIGYNNNVVQDKTVALGSSITTTQANSVVLGNESTDRAATSESKVTILGQDYAFAGLGSASNGVVSVGKVGGERQIINVAAGQLSATSTDAVNGSQLYATNQAISSLQGQVGGAKSTVTEGKNTTITKTTNADGSTDYQVATKDDVSFDSVTVGNIKADAQTNKITGLADGEVSATSNEAVNGSQLHGTAESVANVLGGNAKVNADGTVSTSNIGNTGKDNVHDAIASLQGQVAGSKTSVSAGKNTVVNSSTNADGSNNYQVALADDINLNSVTANQVTANQVKADQVIANQVMANQVNVGKVTIDGTSNKVSGLANGTISKDSTDAINGSQLHQTNSNVAQYLGGGSTLNQDGSIKAPTYNVAGGSYNNVGDALGAVDTRVSNLEQAFYNTNKNVDDLRNDTYAGIAGAMAVGNLPQPTEAGMSMMSAGLSGYRGETAVAVGISAITDSNKIIWKMGASADSRSNIGGAISVGYQWK
nr:YadA-like family protein [Acinetobacter bereziniae]